MTVGINAVLVIILKLGSVFVPLDGDLLTFQCTSRTDYGKNQKLNENLKV